MMKTTNYKLFKYVNGNRFVGNVDKLKESIKEHGQICSIIVNEKYEIIDGQHRFEALKELGMPINYEIVKGLAIDDVIESNTTQKRWSAADYIKSYADRGNTSYKFMNILYEKYAEKIGISSFYTIIQGANTSNIKNGVVEITISRFQEYDKEMEFITKAVDIIKPNLNSKFSSAICFFYHSDNFDNSRLLECFKKYKLGKYGSVDECVEAIANCYNTRLRAKVYYNKEYDEWKTRGNRGRKNG